MEAVRDSAPTLVVFDVDATLSDLTLFRDAFASLGVSPTQGDLWRAGVVRDGLALTIAGAKPSFDDLAVETLRSRLSHEGVEAPLLEQAVDLVMSVFSMACHPDVAPALRALADDGVRVVTLSNGPARTARTLLSNARVLPLVERCLSVEGASPWKPHPDAYHAALAACGVSVGDATLISAHPWDIDGAHRVGLRTVWLNRADECFPSSFARADREVRTLTGLDATWA